MSLTKTEIVLQWGRNYKKEYIENKERRGGVREKGKKEIRIEIESEGKIIKKKNMKKIMREGEVW